MRDQLKNVKFNSCEIKFTLIEEDWYTQGRIVITVNRNKRTQFTQNLKRIFETPKNYHLHSCVPCTYYLHLRL